MSIFLLNFYKRIASTTGQRWPTINVPKKTHEIPAAGKTDLVDSGKPALIVTGLFILLNVTFIFNMPLLPFIDLPNHLAEATIYKYYNTDSLLRQSYTPVPWFYPNSFHALFCSFFPDVEWGNKVFHILYMTLLHGAMFLAIKQSKGNQWYGLLAILFTYNYNVTYGFVGFAISLSVLIVLYYVVLVYMERGNMILNFVIALLLILLFFMHAQNALLGLVIYGLMMAFHHRKSLKRMVIHCLLVPLPLAIMVFTWWFDRPDDNEGSMLLHLKEYYSTSYFENFPIRFRIIVFDNFQLREGMLGIFVAAAIFLCILIPLLALRKKVVRNAISLSGMTCFASLFFAITLGCYMFLPDSLPGQTPIFQRFCTIVILSFIILASTWLRPVRATWLKYFVVIAISAYTLLWFEYIGTFNRENSSFNKALFAGTDRNEKLAGLIYQNHYRGRKTYIHFPNYYLIWTRGLVATKIIDYRFGIVRRPTHGQELPYYHELIGENYSYQPQYSAMDYLLVRGIAPVKEDSNLDGFTLWRQAHPWKLYKSSEQ